MSGPDILPPSAPDVGDVPRRKGLLSKIFGKKSEAKPEAPSVQDELSTFREDEFDLNDIKRRLDTPHDVPQPMPAEQPAVQTEPIAVSAPVPEMPASDELPDIPDGKFDIDNWSTPDDQREPMASAPAPEPLATASVPQEQDTSSDWAAEAPLPEEPTATNPSDEVAKAPLPEESETTDPSDWAAEAPLPEESETTDPSDEAAKAPLPEEPETTDPSDEATPSFPEGHDDFAEPEGEPIEEPADKPAVVSDEHLKGINKEHAAIDEEIADLAEHTAPVTVPEHPLDRPVPEGQEFILKNGRPLKSIHELQEALEVIDDETFAHHVNGQRNDFADWLRHTFHEERLADKVLGAASSQAILTVLRGHERTVDKRYKNAVKEAVSAVEERTTRYDEATRLGERIASLQQKLAEQSLQLAKDKAHFAEELDKRFNKELRTRLKKARADLRKEQRAAERMRKEYEKRAVNKEKELEQGYAAREKKVADSETKLKAKQESLKKIEATLQEERKRFAQEREDAKPLITQAADAKKTLEELAKRESALEEERTKLQERSRKVNAKAASNARQEKVIKELKESLNKRKQEITKTETVLKKNEEEFARLKADFEQRERAFRNDEKKDLLQLKAAQKRADDRLKKAEKAERLLEEKLKERRKIAQYVEEAEKSIKQHTKTHGGDAKASLDARLHAIGADPELPPPESVKNLKIYAMIDDARQALEAEQFQKARELYNKVRDSFNKQDLTPSEKSVLYNTIRELYDDIHLASLK